MAWQDTQRYTSASTEEGRGWLTMHLPRAHTAAHNQIVSCGNTTENSFFFFELLECEVDTDHEWIRERLCTLWILEGLTWIGKDSRVVGQARRRTTTHTSAALCTNSFSVAEEIQRWAITGRDPERWPCRVPVRGFDPLSSTTFVRPLMRKHDRDFSCCSPT